MKTRLNVRVMVLVALSAMSTTVLADRNNDEYEDTARVTKVTPEYQRVNNPREVCREEYVPGRGRDREREREVSYQQTENDRSYAGAVVGGITGALIGSRFGKGHGKEGAIAAGAIAGAVLGDVVDNKGRVIEQQQVVRNDYRGERHRGRMVTRCYTEDSWEQQISGYRVEYNYAGRSYTTMMDRDPGRTIPVQVSVSPVIYRSDRNVTQNRNWWAD